MAESRDTRRAIILSAVEGYLDHLEDDFSEDSELGSVVICGEVHVHGSTIPTYYSSNENGLWRRGMFETLCDYHRIPPLEDDGDDDDVV